MVKKVFFVIVVILAAYCFYLTFNPNYNYHMFKNELKESLRIVRSIDRPKDVMKRVMRQIQEYDIPIVEEDIELTKLNNQYHVKMYWEETVRYFPFYTLYQKTYEFYIDTSE
jgi:hypothetical protein